MNEEMMTIIPMTGAIMWLKLVREGFLGKERLNLELRGWADAGISARIKS